MGWWRPMLCLLLKISEPRLLTTSESPLGDAKVGTPSHTHTHNRRAQEATRHQKLEKDLPWECHGRVSVQAVYDAVDLWTAVAEHTPAHMASGFRVPHMTVCN